MDWKRFVDTLTEEKNIYAELLRLAEEKKTAVISKDIDGLDAVVRREQGAALRLGHWEKQRLAFLDALKDQSPPGSPTLLFFADLAPDKEKLQLRDLHEDLQNIIQKLRKINAENKALIESRLSYVRFALDVLTHDQTAGIYRSGSPNSENNVSKNILDKKV